MDAYPAEFDQPCICDVCGQDVEGEPGRTCPETTPEQQIQKVRDLRAELESRTQELHEWQVAFNQQHKDLIEAKCKAASDCAQEEAQLREMTLAAYQERGNKKPAPGVGIKISKSLQYDENSVRQWAVSNGHIVFLQVDKVSFEAFINAQLKAKRELPPSLADCGAAIITVEQPQATIAKEL